MSMPKDLIDYILVYKANAKGFPGPAPTPRCRPLRRLLELREVQVERHGQQVPVPNGTWDVDVGQRVRRPGRQRRGLPARHPQVRASGIFGASIGLDDRAVEPVRATPPGQLQVHVPIPAPMRRGLRRVAQRRRAWVAAIIVHVFLAAVLFGLCAITVDVARMYAEAQRVQKAADVAAAGGCHLHAAGHRLGDHRRPGRSPPQRLSRTPATSTVVVKSGTQPSQLNVAVSSKIPNYFGRFLGSRRDHDHPARGRRLHRARSRWAARATRWATSRAARPVPSAGGIQAVRARRWRTARRTRSSG